MAGEGVLQTYQLAVETRKQQMSENLLEHRSYNMYDELVHNIVKCNYSKPTAVQMQTTGSGKTVAFLAPVINGLKVPKKVGFLDLILAPTRERFSKKKTQNTQARLTTKFCENSLKKFDVLISTSNRVRYLLHQEPPILSLKSFNK